MRRGWGAQPTDADGDRAELRRLQALAQPIAGPMDTAPLVDVLQTTEHGGRQPIPVRLVGPANLQNLGVRVGGLFSVLLAAAPAPAVMIVGDDERRASIVLGALPDPAGNVRLGRTKTEADDASSFQLVGKGPYLFHFTDRVWARAEVNAVRLSVCVMQWTR